MLLVGSVVGRMIAIRRVRVMRDSAFRREVYGGYDDTRGFPDPRASPAAGICAIVGEIITHDGPLTRASVYQLYVRGCPVVTRATGAVRQPLDRTIDALLRSGEIVQEDGLADGSPDGQVLRLAGAAGVRIRVAGWRDLPEIPRSELPVVLRRWRRQFGSATTTDDDALMRRLLEHYGFAPRLTRRRREYLTKVLVHCADRRRLYGGCVILRDVLLVG